MPLRAAALAEPFRANVPLLAIVAPLCNVTPWLLPVEVPPSVTVPLVVIATFAAILMPDPNVFVEVTVLPVSEIEPAEAVSPVVPLIATPSPLVDVPTATIVPEFVVSVLVPARSIPSYPPVPVVVPLIANVPLLDIAAPLCKLMPCPLPPVQVVPFRVTVPDVVKAAVPVRVAPPPKRTPEFPDTVPDAVIVPVVALRLLVPAICSPIPVVDVPARVPVPEPTLIAAPFKAMAVAEPAFGAMMARLPLLVVIDDEATEMLAAVL